MLILLCDFPLTKILPPHLRPPSRYACSMTNSKPYFSQLCLPLPSPQLSPPTIWHTCTCMHVMCASIHYCKAPCTPTLRGRWVLWISTLLSLSLAKWKHIQQHLISLSQLILLYTPVCGLRSPWWSCLNIPESETDWGPECLWSINKPIMLNQQTRALTGTEKISHDHNKDVSCIQ